MNILAIKDSFHPGINGSNEPEVTEKMFPSRNDFTDWCIQHGANGQWYVKQSVRNSEDANDS